MASFSKQSRVLAVWAVSYVILYLVYALADFLPKWDAYGVSWLKGAPISGYAFVDPLFVFIPFVGFVVAWLATRWAFDEWGEIVLAIPSALVGVIMAYLSFGVALVGYFWNNAFLVSFGRGEPNPGWSSLSFTIEYVLENFLDLLIQSPFFLLVLSLLLGWVSFVLTRTSHAHATPSSPAS